MKKTFLVLGILVGNCCTSYGMDKEQEELGQLFLTGSYEQIRSKMAEQINNEEIDEETEELMQLILAPVTLPSQEKLKSIFLPETSQNFVDTYPMFQVTPGKTLPLSAVMPMVAIALDDYHQHPQEHIPFSETKRLLHAIFEDDQEATAKLEACWRLDRKQEN